MTVIIEIDSKKIPAALKTFLSLLFQIYQRNIVGIQFSEILDLHT